VPLKDTYVKGNSHVRFIIFVKTSDILRELYRSFYVEWKAFKRNKSHCV